MERTLNKSQHTKLTLEKKILPLLLPGFELATSRSRVRRSYQQAIPATSMCSHVKLTIDQSCQKIEFTGYAKRELFQSGQMVTPQVNREVDFFRVPMQRLLDRK